MERRLFRHDVSPFVWWSMPGLLASLSVLVHGLARPPSTIWYVADGGIYFGVLTPVCFFVLIVKWFLVPPVAWTARVVAIVISVPTAYLAWRWATLAMYFLGIVEP